MNLSGLAGSLTRTTTTTETLNFPSAMRSRGSEPSSDGSVQYPQHADNSPLNFSSPSSDASNLKTMLVNEAPNAAMDGVSMMPQTASSPFGTGSSGSDSTSLIDKINQIIQSLLQQVQQLFALESASNNNTDQSSSTSSQTAMNSAGSAQVRTAVPSASSDAADESVSGNSSLTTSDPSLQKLVNQYGSDYQTASQETGVPASLLASLTMQESGGDVNATSVNPGNGKTDSGMNQINPDTYAEMRAQYPDKLGADSNDPKNQIMCSALMLRDGKEKFGSYDAALRAYNSGDDQVDLKNLSNVSLGDPNYVKEVNAWNAKFS